MTSFEAVGHGPALQIELERRPLDALDIPAIDSAFLEKRPARGQNG